MQELARILGALPVGRGRDEARTALARAIWPGVAGGPIATHSRVVDVTGGSLKLAADTGQWAEAISTEGPSLIAALRQSYPALGLRRLEVEVGQVVPPPEPEPVPPATGAEPTEAIRRAAESVRDLELRRVLLRTAGAYLSRRRRNREAP